MGNEGMRKIKEMIFLDVTELSLMKRLKPIEEKREYQKIQNPRWESN